ncbi:hypothetical protein T09_9744 [Trichinella sp. T9]|nr:hypothetical protein T09_9744 [Trichinella sp. T9]
MQIEFAKFEGEQFCRLHSGHLRRSVHNGGNLHDARNCVSAIRPRKEEDSFAEYEEALLNFEWRCQLVPVMKANMKDQLGSTDNTNGEERRGERWAVVTLQAYAETTSHTQRHSVVPADVRQMGNLTMEELWTAESTWEPQGQEAETRQGHTGDT